MNNILLNKIRDFSIYGPYRAKHLKDLITVYYDYSKPEAKHKVCSLLLMATLDACEPYIKDEESRWHNYCVELYQDTKEAAIDFFIDEHPLYFDSLE